MSNKSCICCTYLQCKSGGELVAGLVHVRWRQEVTKRLHTSYFHHRIYYRLNVMDRRVDNP